MASRQGLPRIGFDSCTNAPERQDDTRETLTRDLDAARVESERLADAIQRGGPMDVLLDRLRACQERRAELEEQIAATRPIVAPVTGAGLEQRLRAKLADWRGLLTRNVDSGREVLRALLMGPLRFTPIIEDRRRAYAFEGAVALERLVSGVIDLPTLTGVASPISASWNQLRGWLRAVDGCRRAA